MSGAKIVYHIKDTNQGNRIKGFKTKVCPNELDKSWCHLDPNANYSIALTSYIANGNKTVQIQIWGNSNNT